MKEYLVKTKINNGDTGEFIEEVRLMYIDENDKFENADQLYDALSFNDFEELDNIVDEYREYLPDENDIYRVSVVELENE